MIIMNCIIRCNIRSHASSPIIKFGVFCKVTQNLRIRDYYNIFSHDGKNILDNKPRNLCAIRYTRPRYNEVYIMYGTEL